MSRFVGPNGEFVSSYKLEKGMINIGYIEELCEWIFYHPNKASDEKLLQILALENVIKEILNGDCDNVVREGWIPPFGVHINYIPKWSKKLKELK